MAALSVAQQVRVLTTFLGVLKVVGSKHTWCILHSTTESTEVKVLREVFQTEDLRGAVERENAAC